jgi:hypothetical protein
LEANTSKGGKLFEYTLRTMAVPDLDASEDVFKYAIHHISLTDVERPIPADYTRQQRQKYASIGAQAHYERKNDEIIGAAKEERNDKITTGGRT